MSEGKVLSWKAPSMRCRRGIVEIQWGSTLFIFAAGKRSGRTWEGGSRARRVPAQTQVVPEGHWHSYKTPAKAGQGKGADVETNIPGPAPAKLGCDWPEVRNVSYINLFTLFIPKFLLPFSPWFSYKIPFKKKSSWSCPDYQEKEINPNLDLSFGRPGIKSWLPS